MENNEFDMESFREQAIAKLKAGDGLLGGDADLLHLLTLLEPTYF